MAEIAGDPMTEQLEVVAMPRRLATLSPKVPGTVPAGRQGAERFFEFFTVNIRNKNTRRAYYKAARAGK